MDDQSFSSPNAKQANNGVPETNARVFSQARRHSHSFDGLPQQTLFVIICLLLISVITGFSRQLPDYVLNALKTSLEAQGFHIENIEHHRMSFNNLILHNVRLRADAPITTSFTASQLQIDWKPRATSPRQWITGITAHNLDLKSSQLLNDQHPLSPLNGLYHLAKKVHALPWPLTATGQLNANTDELTTWSFALNRKINTQESTLLAWSNATVGQLFVMTLPKKAPLPSTASTTTNDDTHSPSPYNLKWETPYHELSARITSPVSHSSPLTPASQWHFQGKLTLKTPKHQDSNPPTHTLQSLFLGELSNLKGFDTITASNFSLHFPGNTDLKSKQHWFRYVEGEGNINVQKLTLQTDHTLSVNVPTSHTIQSQLHISGKAHVLLKPGNWVATLTETSHVAGTLSRSDKKNEIGPKRENKKINSHAWLSTLISALLVPQKTTQMSVDLPANTQLTLNDNGYFQLRAEDTSQFTIDTETHHAHGTLSALMHESGESTQSSGLFNVTWETDKHKPNTFLTQAKLVLTDTLCQLDLNGNTPDSSTQWDVHAGFDADTAQGHFDRQIVLDPHLIPTHNATAQLAAFLSQPAPNTHDAILTPKTHLPHSHKTRSSQHGFSQMVIATQADFQLNANSTKDHTKWAEDWVFRSHRPSTFLQEPLLFTPEKTEKFSGKKQPLTVTTLRTKVQWYSLALNRLLNAISLDNCSGDGSGTATLDLTWPTPAEMSQQPTVAFHFTQAQPTTLVCHAAKHLSTSYFALQDKSPDGPRHDLEKKSLPSWELTSPLKRYLAQIDLHYPVPLKPSKHRATKHWSTEQWATEIRFQKPSEPASSVLPIRIMQTPNLSAF